MFGILQWLDESVLFFIQTQLRSPLLDRLMLFATSLGNSGLLWIILAFLLLFYKRTQECARTMLCSITFAMLLGDHILKPLIGRVRPCNQFPEISLLIPRITSPSFPSGHTMVGFAAAAVIYHYHHGLGLLAYVVAAIIGLSRIYLFVHYPSDVLGGLILGVAVSAFLIFVLERSRDEKRCH